MLVADVAELGVSTQTWEKAGSPLDTAGRTLPTPIPRTTRR